MPDCTGMTGIRREPDSEYGKIMPWRLSLKPIAMAEITVAAAGKKPGARRAKRLSTRVDLTPMVDLGFLLITFFIFSSRLSEPKSLRLHVPKPSTDSTNVGAGNALTAIPVNSRTILYYHGAWQEALASNTWGFTGWSVSDGIGEVIRKKKAALESKQKGAGNELILIIKPTDETSFQDLVNLLDEILINDLSRYAITDITEEEQRFVETNSASH